VSLQGKIEKKEAFVEKGASGVYGPWQGGKSRGSTLRGEGKRRCRIVYWKLVLDRVLGENEKKGAIGKRIYST